MILPLLIALAVPAAPQASTPPAAARGQVWLNISPAGQAIAKKYLGTPDPEMVQLAQRGAGLAQKIRALSAAKTLDMVQLATLIRQQETLQSAMRKRSNDRMLAMLGEMNEADRISFVRGIATAQPPKAPAR